MKGGFVFNEGGTPINFLIRWKKPVGFYFYFFGWRFTWLGKS